MNNDNFHHQFLSTRFGAVHYWTTGSGPPVLLLHQSAQSSDEYLAVAPLLASEYQVISLDLPGHGASDTPDHELNVEEYCEAVLAVLDELAITSTHVVGHHGGCMLATNIAVNNPRRVTKVVLSGGGVPDPVIVEQLLNKPMTRDLAVDAEGDFLQKTWTVYQKMSAPGTPPEISFLPFVTGLKARLRPYDMHYEVLRWDYRSALDQLQHETLLIKAEFDLFSGDVEGLDRKLPNSEMVVLPGCGPWLFYEKPGDCARTVQDFLSR